MLIRFLVRDLMVVFATVVSWWAFAAHSAGDDYLADISGWVVGLLLGACAYLAHEWSHYLGAVAMGSRVDVGENLASGFLFSFAAEGNSLSQFVVMSLAGFVATAGMVAFFYLGLPDNLLATRIARGSVVFLSLLGIVLELPLLTYGIVTRGVPKQVSV